MMTSQTVRSDHERALRSMASRHELPAGNIYMVDASTGIVTKATVWVNGDVWFFDHYDSSHPHYRREYDCAVCRPSTLWRQRDQVVVGTEVTDKTVDDVNELVRRLKASVTHYAVGLRTTDGDLRADAAAAIEELVEAMRLSVRWYDPDLRNEYPAWYVNAVALLTRMGVKLDDALPRARQNSG